MTAPRVAPQPAPEPSQSIGGFAVNPHRYRYIQMQVANIFRNGGSEDAAKQFVQMELQRPGSGKVPDPIEQVHPDAPSYLQGVSMGLIQGATFGWGDEALGSLTGLLTHQGAVAGIREYREAYDAWRSEHKLAGHVTEVAGAVGGMMLGGEVLGAVKGAEAGVNVARVAQSAGRVSLSRLAAQGALYGAVQGAGDTKSLAPSERLWGAVTGGTAAAIATPLLIGGGRLVAPVGKAIGKSVVNALPEQIQTGLRAGVAVRVRQMLARALANDNKTVNEALAHSQDLVASGVSPTIVDVGGDAVEQLVRAAGKQASPTRAAVIQGFRDRQAQQGERLIGWLVSRALQNPQLGTKNAEATIDFLKTQGDILSKPHYQDAFQQVVKVPRDLAAKLFERPAFRRAWEIGRSAAADEDEWGIGHGLKVESLPESIDIVKGLVAKGVSPAKAKAIADQMTGGADFVELPVRGVDYAKRYMRAAVKQLTAEGKPDAKYGLPNFRAERAALGSLVDVGRQQVGAYDRALSIFAGHNEAADMATAALRGSKKLGVKPFLQESPYQIAKLLKEADPATHDYYRLGAIQALGELVQGKSGDAAKLLGGTTTGQETLMAQRIRALFYGNKPLADEAIRQIHGEALLSKGGAAVDQLPSQASLTPIRGGSPTDLPYVRHGVGVAIASAARQHVVQSQQQLSQREADAILSLAGRGLQHPGEIKTLLTDLAQYEARLSQPKVAAKRAAAVIGSQTGAGVRSLVRASKDADPFDDENDDPLKDLERR